MEPLQIITISTGNFRAFTERLLLSLQRSGGVFHLTVFCEDAAEFSLLPRLGPCTIEELPEIRSFGVKRAKFAAYSKKIKSGGFLYLDSDIIVLSPLDELADCKMFSGCPDDLSACSFIQNRRYPWPGDPALKNCVYINSGVFYAPFPTRDFFDELHELSLSDDLWSRYILPDGLYDNHFLCAQLNLKKQPVHLLDPLTYNWQGFYKEGTLQVCRRDNSLVNRESGTELKLVHFAGIQDIDHFLRALPRDISSFLYSRCVASARANDVIIEAPDYRLSCLSLPKQARPGENFTVRIRLQNRCAVMLSSFYHHPVHVAYHWFDPFGDCLVWDGLRTKLPFDIGPGDSAAFDISVSTPQTAEASECQIQIDLLQEGAFWFHDRNPDLGSSQIIKVALAPY
jgi:hypothetical protein